MNHRTLFSGLSYLIFVGLAISLAAFGDFHSPRSIAPEAATPAAITTELKANPIVSAPTSTANLVRVVRVVDGDTIELEGGEKVRYIGIDTPETVDPRKPVQCFGLEASAENKKLVEGQLVRLEKDISERDKYGRLLHYVWVGDTFVNLKLVADGFARVSTYPPDVAHQAEFLAAEKTAQESNLGLWNSCPSVKNTAVVVPSNQTASNPPNSNCLIKGNISASGEKIYHLQGCDYYTQTKIDLSRGERWFCSEAEAVMAGWRKALNCPSR